MLQTKLDEIQIDQLMEIMNIGASHASTALSRLVNQPVGLSIPFVHMDTVNNVNKYYSQCDETISAALVKVSGDIKGAMYFLFSYKNKKKLTDLLLLGIKDKSIKDELNATVVEELGNILSGASLAAFSKFMNLNLPHSASEVLDGTLREVVERVSAGAVGVDGTVLMFQIDFTIGDDKVDTNFMFFIDDKATKTLLDALKLKY
ncbi:chemotaxis protein CheC [Candidatus Parcubacteria bacterium]|nr:chemotaxis protein CheC [Patescibacteria group bacterium]MBU4309384.1 chemotaxis protein CheC [Patescibacteria group bacterium]MBU4432513.1 chemotaxis protein CheC [Patescibacteria group bacterium]MBU4577745.1 chemotaxis protein CheC [Patescibacteria group bacterium]MCG2697430.1 chemotaxis protein CheC [Candidatus Parcubacteria bacterium]